MPLATSFSDFDPHAESVIASAIAVPSENVLSVAIIYLLLPRISRLLSLGCDPIAVGDRPHRRHFFPRPGQPIASRPFGPASALILFPEVDFHALGLGQRAPGRARIIDAAVVEQQECALERQRLFAPFAIGERDMGCLLYTSRCV